MSGSWESRQPRLTKEQLEDLRDAWSSFRGFNWRPFAEACIARGILPPAGSATDDLDSSLRARLWRIADTRPRDLGRWAREAPGDSLFEVAEYCFARFSGIRAEVGPDVDPVRRHGTTDGLEHIGEHRDELLELRRDNQRLRQANADLRHDNELLIVELRRSGVRV